jgi:MFS family permease
MPSLSPAARRYLAHAALLTFGLAVSSLFYNLLLLSLGYDERTATLPLVGPISLLGLLNSVPVLVAGLSSLPIWLLVGRIGPRRALMLSALLSACSLFGAAIGTSPTALMLAACIGGPASVLFHVSAAPFMMRHSDSQERDALFSLNAALNIGVAGLGNLLGGYLPGLLAATSGLPIQSADVYQRTFAVAAVLVLLAALPLLVPVRGERGNNGTRSQEQEGPKERGDSGAGRQGPERGGLVAQLRWLVSTVRHALPFMVSPLLISCGAALLIPFLNVYFRQRFAASDATLGLLFTAIGVSTGLATLAAPLLSRRLGKIGSVVLTQTLAIPCLLLLGAAPMLGLAAAVAMLRGALMNMASPLYDAFAMETSPEQARPVVIGLINGAFAAGYVLGPIVSAEVQRRYGFAPLFGATATLYALAAAANALLFLRPARAPTPPSDR